VFSLGDPTANHVRPHWPGPRVLSQVSAALLSLLLSKVRDAEGSGELRWLFGLRSHR